MLLHEPARRPSYRKALKRIPTRQRTLYAVAAFVLWSAAVALTGARSNPGEWAREWTADRGLIAAGDAEIARGLVSYPFVWASARTTRAAVPVLTFDIKFKHLMTLRARRAEAIERGVLLHGDDDFVPASIRYGAGTFPADVRLKGDLVDHLRGDKWAFRVKLEDEGRLFGMRRFSLMHPKGRDYHAEALFFDAARQEGILAPRHFYADVVLNGESLGRMIVEEHFTRELLESQARREGVIVRFDETPFWQNGNPWYLDTYANAMVRPFQDSMVARSEVLSANLRLATGLLRGFVHGALPASEVFDAELMGRYLGLSEAWGARHSLRWNNMRFYFNPVTALLEPVAFDAMVGYPLSAVEMHEGRYPFVKAALEDSIVRSHYEATLSGWSRPDFGAFANLERNEAQYRRVLRRNYPLLRPYDVSAVARRAADLLALNANGPTWARERPILHAYTVEDQGRHYLELASMVPESLEVTRVYWRGMDDSSSARTVALQGASLPLPLVLDGTPIGRVPQPIRLRYRTLDGPATLWVDVHPLGMANGVQAVQSTRYFPTVARSPLAPPGIDQVVARHAFMRWDPGSRTVTVPSGTWHVAEAVVLPRGVRMVLSAGATLNFAPDAAVVVRGPLHARGEAGRPVRLRGAVRNGQRAPWPGIVVLEADERSDWSHVEVIGTAGLTLEEWQLTSGVTFYESDVTISHARFEGNRTEDVLNVIRSAFALSDVHFADAASDGLDADFADGTISGGSFERIGWAGGGDAIDVSGADVSIEGARFSGIGDKAISVGEGGSVRVRDVAISDATAGVVSKDASTVHISGSRIRDIRLAALMAYIKKPEYGPASLTADSIDFENVARETWVQTESSVRLNGQPVATVAVNVDSLYQTAMRKSGVER